MPATMIEKWIAKIEGDDIFICQVLLKQTPKLWTYVPRPHGEGNNTGIGFKGTKESHSWLLRFNKRFGRGDKQFYDTYEEARNAMHERLLSRLATAKRNLDKATDLLDTFTSVPYEKQD